jgi:hypothetical protein
MTFDVLLSGRWSNVYNADFKRCECNSVTIIYKSLKCRHYGFTSITCTLANVFIIIIAITGGQHALTSMVVAVSGYVQ